MFIFVNKVQITDPTEGVKLLQLFIQFAYDLLLACAS